MNNNIRNENIVSGPYQPNREVENLDINGIVSTVNIRGLVVSEKSETLVVTLQDHIFPNSRHLWSELPIGSSSSQTSSNIASGIGEASVYHPVIKRIIYYKEIMEKGVRVESFDIDRSQPGYPALMRELNGHLRAINFRYGNGDRYVPAMGVMQCKTTTYQDGSISRIPLICDLIQTPPGFWWNKDRRGDFILNPIPGGELVNDITRQRRETLRIQLDFTRDHLNFLVSDYIAELSILCFYSIDFGGFGSFYGRLVILLYQLYKKRSLLKDYFLDYLAEIEVLVAKTFY